MLPNIVTRGAAGLEPPTGRLVPVVYPVGVDLWVHHGGRNAAMAFSLRDSIRILRGYQRHHVEENGWSDIGYGWAVDNAGNIIECRGAHVGAHSPGRNHEPSVVCIGDWSNTVPPPPMVRAVAMLADHLRAGDLRGHRENTATDCPGDAAMRVIVNMDANSIGDGRTLRDRIIASGKGARTADVLIQRLREGYSGTIPNRSDSVFFRRLRDNGLGVASARRVVKAGRRS